MLVGGQPAGQLAEWVNLHLPKLDCTTLPFAPFALYLPVLLTTRIRMSESTAAESLTFTKLGESNFSTWKYDMQAALQTKRLWRLVSGQEAKPTEPDKLELWNERAEQAAGLIY